MSHIHIPDGVLPLWIIVLGWAVTAALLFWSVRVVRLSDVQRRLPLLGVMSALMLAGMTLELVPIGYHINLTVLTGIVLGPALGFLAAFIVDLILALLGHGGITVVGLNTLVIGAEITLGSVWFRVLRRLLAGRIGPGLAAAGATVLSLFLSTLLMLGIVGVSNSAPFQMPEAGAVEVAPGTLSLRNPFGEGVLSWEVLAAPVHGAAHQLDFGTFAAVVLGLGLIGWLLEAALIALIVRYVARVRPDLIGSVPERRAIQAEAVSG
jgi:cobalt/nickel transport system permease protein